MASMQALLVLAFLQLPQLSWAPSVQAAKSYATKTGKPIMLVMRLDTTPGLGRAFEDPRMAEISKSFICVCAFTLESAQTIVPLPPSKQMISVFFVEPSGKVIGRMGGLFMPWAMVQSAKQILWARSVEPQLASRIKAGKADGACLAQMSIVRALTGDFSEADRFLREAETKHAPRSLLGEAYLAIGEQYRVERRYKESIPALLKSAALAKEDEQIFAARARLTGSYIRLGELGKAEAQAKICNFLRDITLEERTLARSQLDRIEAIRQAQLSR
jgi:hypothetical protein